MTPRQDLPYDGDFASSDAYISSLLDFVCTSDLFQILCGGTHIIDFFTSEPGLFHVVLPPEWHPFLLECDTMRLLDMLMRHDLSSDGMREMPSSLFRYVKSIRDLSLCRDHGPSSSAEPLPPLPPTARVGMKPKKIHEVTHFANYVHRLAGDVYRETGDEVTHYVDFGSGQNYLGRALASELYRKHVVAVEGRENNVVAARGFDMTSGLAIKQKVMRNKKLWNRIVGEAGPHPHDNPETLAETMRNVVRVTGSTADSTASHQHHDFRPRDKLRSDIAVQRGKGHVQYVSGRLDSGDLSDVIGDIIVAAAADDEDDDEPHPLKLMAISIHSCGNLSHHAIRSLVLNHHVRAVAIVGCCYNLMTEKLGAPEYDHAHLRPTLQALNSRLGRESNRFDPHGFPMSARLSTHANHGIRLNVTARMMACQAPRNWGRIDSDAFFTRHFFRAVLQKILLDRGVVARTHHTAAAGPLDTFTQPITVGRLPRQCYTSLGAYVRGSIEKLSTANDECADVVREKMAGMSDQEIQVYEAEFLPRKKELCVMWSLMAFSAMVVESLIAVDRWVFLKEQPEVKSAWVETVFDYSQSPRNLVVVGVKERG